METKVVVSPNNQGVKDFFEKLNQMKIKIKSDIESSDTFKKLINSSKKIG
jgi:hypothetical protein